MDNRLITTGSNWPRPRVSVWTLFAVAFFALSLISVALAPPAFAANPPPEQTYYVPLPEQQAHSSLEAINTTEDTGTEIDSVVSIVSSDAATLVYYDHWEDGYEPDITNPAATRVAVFQSFAFISLPPCIPIAIAGGLGPMTTTAPVLIRIRFNTGEHAQPEFPEKEYRTTRPFYLGRLGAAIISKKNRIR